MTKWLKLTLFFINHSLSETIPKPNPIPNITLSGTMNIYVYLEPRDNPKPDTIKQSALNCLAVIHQGELVPG